MSHEHDEKNIPFPSFVVWSGDYGKSRIFELCSGRTNSDMKSPNHRIEKSSQSIRQWENMLLSYPIRPPPQKSMLTTPSLPENTV